MSNESKLQDRKFREQKLTKTRQRRQALETDKRLVDLVAKAPRNDLLPSLAMSHIAIADLSPSPHRTRRSTREHVQRLIASISDMGFTLPILVANGEIIDGHVRVEAAQALALKHVPAIEVSHLAPSEIRKLRLAINRTAELGEWDLEALRNEFIDLIELEVDLTSAAFTLEERDIILLDPVGKQSAEGEIPEPPANPVTRLGDIWVMDDHLLICGNALERQTYDNLLAGEPVHAVLSDPPYNVKIKGNVSGLGKKVHAEFVMASGEMSPTEWQAFLNAVLEQFACVVVDGAVLFLFMDWRSIDRLYAAGHSADLRLINLAVWNKESGGMGGLYRSAHELIAVFCKGERPHTNNVKLGRNGRDRSNVWSAPGANRRGSSAAKMLALHATPKPVSLCVDAILDVTIRGQTVLDAFLGSGTTLIAAEETGRCCRGIELEPKFVDVAIRRWEETTGKSAILAATGETFSAVTARRAAEADDSVSATDSDGRT